MFDWQVNSEDAQEQPLAHDAREEPTSGDVRRWRVWGGLLLLLIVASLLAFRWRLTERTQLMESDLKAFIRHEEQQRAFGLTEEADKLIVSDAPQAWQEAYRSTFVVNADDMHSVELTIEEIELKGTNAYVGLDDVPQVRFYRLERQEWRRAPLSDAFWGEERQIEIAEEMTIVYPAREEAFAQRLVDDLAILFEQWPAKKEPITIRIEPTEFAPAMLYATQSGSMHEIVFNSPKLVMPPHSTDGGVRKGVDGEGVIRLALANNLLEEANLDRDTQQSALPGAPTFLAAIRNTFILRWALPDEAIPRQIWRDKVKRRSKSPILGKWHINREEVLLAGAWQPHLSQATFLLMADYLYDQHGIEGLDRVIKQLPTAESWDRIFYPLTGHYTIELEEAVRFADSESQTDSRPAPELPLHVTVLDIDAQTGVFEVKLASSNEPLSIQAIDGTLVDPEGISDTANCAALYKELSITEGDWLAVGQTLQARQIVARDLSPSILLPAETTKAPPDTFAYLVERGSRKSRVGFAASTFMALSEDGTITPLTTLSPPFGSGWHLQSNMPWPARFLLTLHVPNCEQAWLLMYDPQQGIVGHWLTSLPGLFSGPAIWPGFVWRPQERDFILTEPILYGNGSNSSQKSQYWSASPGEPLRFLGEVENSADILGWFGEKVVTVDENRNYVKLIDPKSDEVTKTIEVTRESARFFMLSEDKKHLFYVYPLPFSERSVLRVLNLESGEDKYLFYSPDGEWWRPVGGRSSTNRLLLEVGPQRSGRQLPKHLVLVDLNASSQPSVIMKIPFSQNVTNALVCENDSVLMTIHEEGVTEVRLWKADGSTKSLLKTYKQLQLLSCR